MKKTTIQINIKTLEKLRALKNFERQSYDDVLNNLIDNYESEFLSEGEIGDIQVALENVKRGKVTPIEEVTRELDIALR